MQIRVIEGQPYPLGVSKCTDGINFSFVSEEKECGVVLFDRKSPEEIARIPFPDSYSIGNIHCMKLQGLLLKQISYCFYENDKLVTDTRGKGFTDGYLYGQPLNLLNDVRKAIVPDDKFDWSTDQMPNIPYDQSIVYCLHVRGFTKHISSKVKGKGTFLGVIGKIPYLKDLGITTLEFQPFYEFEEIEKSRSNISPYMSRERDYLNYWGYKEGFYYSPKNSYSSSKNTVFECKRMISELHKSGMEVIMQFYFPDSFQGREIPDILRYWVKEFHVDGFHLKGNIPEIEHVLSDPSFAKTKIWYHRLVNTKNRNNDYFGVCSDQYRNDMRKYLKGDEAMVKTVMYHLTHNINNGGQINYLTNYDGFTLMDLVSYDRKHNEMNGEENHDGNDFNYSWNCGQEGKSRKKGIITLRYKQIKNALMLLFLSQATPLIFMGDEFGNSQDGNNNPYCQDSAITWLNWNQLMVESEIYHFVKKLIALRKAHPVLRQPSELKLMDYGACGFPDVSFHGEYPWKPDISPYSRHFGIMYCGKYAWISRIAPDDNFYIAYNLHWEEHNFILPVLPKGMQWEFIMSTDEQYIYVADGNQMQLKLPGRSICVLKSNNIKNRTEG